jgi:lipopolysaccharide/colanic/teichoic acid biosynthesis glycosyltransferase
MLRLDLQYIQRWSLPLDCLIILRTIPTVLSRRGAY